MPDPVELLARDDKWSLGAGDGVLFAPRYPVWLDAPGFWDEATLHQYAWAPLFTVSLLDEDGVELPLRAVSRRWTPAELTVEYRLGNGIAASEVRTVQPGGVFASEWRVRALRGGRLHLVAWTTQPLDDGVDAASLAWTGAVGFRRTLVDRWGVSLDFDAELGCAGGATTWGALVGDAGAPHPDWRLTPLPSLWAGGLPDAVREGVASPDSVRTLYAAVHKVLDAGSEGAAATFAMRIVPADARLRVRAPELRATDRVAGEAREPLPAEAAPDAEAPATLVRASRQRWQALLARSPRVACSDPYVEGYLRHRWWSLWHMLTGNGAGEYDRALVCEGPGEWHVPSAEATPALVREMRWLRDPAPARDALRAWFARQRPDGGFPARLALQHVPDEAAPSAAWGDALAALDAAAPDDALLRDAVPVLLRWVDAVEPAVVRALARDRRADGGDDTLVGRVADLVGALDALAELAPRVGGIDGAELALRAEELRTLARERLWDAGRGVFHDGSVGAAGLFLYGAVADAAQASRLEKALADPALFGTPYPLPTTAGAIEGARVEPGVACRAADAVARAAVRHAPALRPLAGRLVRRVVHTLFADGDLRRPGSYEHYDAVHGHASRYRGWDDLQRAAVADLVLQWIAGIRPHADGVTVDPLPSGIDRVEVTGLRLRGCDVDVLIEGARVQVTRDGERIEAALGEPIELHC